MLFSDLLRIAVDADESLPSLTFLEQELLMNGLTEYVWLANNGSKSISRLVPDPRRAEAIDSDDGLDHGAEKPGSNLAQWQQLPPYADQSIDAYIVRHSRRLSSLRQRRSQLIKSLRRWQADCLTRQLPSTIAERSSLLSCFLLYHLGFLQLRCPLDQIHTLSYLPKDRNPAQQDILTQVRTWSKSKDAVVALKHALAIAGLIEQETKRPLAARSQVNFLALVGLNHSAMVVWTLAGTHGGPIKSGQASTAGTESAIGLTVGNDYVLICQANKASLMEAFSRLYVEISPAWAGKSSFSAAVMRMRGLEFPALAGENTCPMLSAGM